MNILISVNRDFFEHAKEMLFSLASNNEEFLNIFLMHKELTNSMQEEIKQFIQNKCHGELHIVNFQIDELKNMPVTNGKGAYFGLEAYNRLFCQYVLPEEIDRILYLDADILINSNISTLYNMEFESNIFYVGCKDESAINKNDNIRLNLSSDYPYVNSGMLLINVKGLRNKYTIAEIIDYVKEKKEILLYPDQDILNLLYKDEIKVISNSYNYILKDIDFYKDEQPYIIHYAGQEKPWKIEGGKYKFYYLKPYYKNLIKQKKIIKLIEMFFLHRGYYILFKIKKCLKK